MPVTVVDYDSDDRGVGAYCRLGRLGPERELVEWFLQRNPVPVPRGCRMTVFREPRLESGFPDLVIVTWHEATACRWEPVRACLTNRDVRLLHYLFSAGGCTTTHLKSVFANGTTRSLARLEAAAVVRLKRATWTVGRLSEIFAIREILAVEAKVSDWNAALHQAFLNTWFASASYILVPRVPKRSCLLEQAGALGVGVWAMEGHLQRGCRLLQKIPCSYASWLFNEWVWRAARSDKGSPLGRSA